VQEEKLEVPEESSESKVEQVAENTLLDSTQVSVEETKDEAVHKSGKIAVTVVSGEFEGDDGKTIQVSCEA
jgi:hypothetical protein